MCAHVAAPRLLLLMAFGIAAAAPPTARAEDHAGPQIQFRQSKGTEELRVELSGLERTVIESLARDELDREAWSRILAVSVAADDGESPPPPMLGTYQVERNVVIFEPRFPLRPGVMYRAVFDPAALPGDPANGGKPVAAEFSIPRPARAEATTVAAVYPTRNTLPENQLKFYIHFSAPMSRGAAYEHVRLINDQGERIEYPFLELGEELWDPSVRRFTLFFDPGRIKRGLQPRELFGPALEAGRSYTLIIDKDWSDAAGDPLGETFTKKFKVTAPDDVQPDPANWRISTPAAGTRDPLTVTFVEPLDHAMLQRVLFVRDPRGDVVPGEIEVDREETRWRLRPEHVWTPGQHSLIAETTLEDLAGNSIGRPFEVDVFRPIEKQIERQSVALPFKIASDSR